MNALEKVRKKILEVSGLYADTEEKKDILSDFNLDVREREILGIAGVEVTVNNNLLKY